MSNQSNSFDVIRYRVEKKLKGFAADFPDNLSNRNMDLHRPDAKLFPVPELVLFTLRDLLRWSWGGHGEKVRWSVYGSVSGEPVIFELRKFGFIILLDHDSKIPISRIVSQLRTALLEVEKFLKSFAELQVDQGELLIVNRFSEFNKRYHFFRDLAAKAYESATNSPSSIIKDEADTQQPIERVSSILNNLFEAKGRMIAFEREGFFHSTAMVDSYFSLLEHQLVLLRAFTGQPFIDGEFRQFLQSSWDEKLKSVLPILGDTYAENILGRMRRIKERIRNPFAHGGFENENGSFFFHLPNIGAIPANFTRFGDSVRFSFMPIEVDDFGEICTVFDQLDALLSSRELVGPHKLMTAGVDPSFNADTLSKYANATSGDDAHLEAFIECWDYEWMRHANMDY